MKPHSPDLVVVCAKLKCLLVEHRLIELEDAVVDHA